MLLDTRTVNVPAQEEIDADLDEYGHIGIRCRAEYGNAAVDAGAPDSNEDDRTCAIDAIANILHWLEDKEVSPAGVLDMALTHFEAERDGVEG